MPPFFPSWTNCSQPSQWYNLDIGWTLGISAIIGAVLGSLINGLSSWETVVSGALLGACLGGILWCTWWLNIRLICLGGDRSAIGVIFETDQQSVSNAFDFGHYDTDFTFDLLLWPFAANAALPGTFVGQTPSNPPGPMSNNPVAPTPADGPDQFNAHEWDPVTQGTLFGNAAFWQGDQPPPALGAIPFVLIDAFGEPVADVKDQVQLILPQSSMVSLQRPFTGQISKNNGNTGGLQNPSWTNQWGSDQQFLLHCEIEGSGIHALRDFLSGLAVAFGVATAVSTIPVIGPVWSAIIDIIAFLVFLFGGPAIQSNNQASPPTGGGFGGPLNVFDPTNAQPGDPVDVAYCFGRWVYDSLHSGWNELHPLHFMIKITTMTNGNVANGIWPPGLGQMKDQLDQQFGFIFSPPAAALQSQPQNQWKLHPLLDGCAGATPYPATPPPPATQ